MVRKVSILAAIVVMFSFCSHARAAQISVSWDGGGDGRSWEDPYNWDPDIVPDNAGGNTFAVTIDNNSIGGGEMQVYLQQDRTITRLDTSGAVRLTSGRLNWIALTVVDVNGLTNYGELKIFEQGDIHSNVTNTAGAELYLKDLYIIGNLHNLAGGFIEFDDAYVMGENSTGVVENAGFIITFGELEAFNTFHNTGQINIYDGGCGSDSLFHNDVNGVIKGSGILYADQLQNKGQITAFGGSLLVVCGGAITNTGLLRNKPLASLHIRLSLFIEPVADVNNFGTIEVNASGGVAFDCNLVNKPNGIIKLLGGTLAATNINQSADATFNGQGNITTSNLIIEAEGLIRLTGPTNIFGNVQIDPNATLEISDGQTLVKGHTTCNNGTIHMIGGRIICQEGLTNNNCNIIWEPGTYTNLADFNLDGTVNFKDFADFANTWLWQASWY